MSKHRAVGVHVFAGGFTLGVKEVFDVPCQLEIFDLGKQTVEKHGIEFIQMPRWEDWGQHKKKYEGCSFCFGNPRCTGFSCLTGGYGADAHGPWARQTKDIHDLCEFALMEDVPVICWESVQQAYTTGRELIQHLVETKFKPRGYRVAHLFLNAAAFGSVQQRKRYFFVAYRGDKNFNVKPPRMLERHVTVGDVLHPLRGRTAVPMDHAGADIMHPDVYVDSGESMQYLCEFKPGQTLNGFMHDHAELRREEFVKTMPRTMAAWDRRTSNIPFSLHCVQKLRWDGFCPVLAGDGYRYVHPVENRPITVREAAAIMGWGDRYPVGPHPYGQLGKGIAPSVGQWLAEQVQAYLNDDWGQEDFESTYDRRRNVWVGRKFSHGSVKPPEKVFGMNTYSPVPPKF